MSQWIEEVEETIIANRLFQDGERILVAVSGGLDSIVLLTVIHQMASRHRWKLIVGHFNHQLRGKQSDADEQFVRKFARKLKLAIAVGRGDVRKVAGENGMSLEMAARGLRHEFLAKTAMRQKARTIAIAHHADDQVELFFLRLLRGSGGTGLGGMKRRSPSPADQRITLARPLLDQPKAALEEYARANNLHFSQDATNASLDIQRNRIRHELLPLLKAHYQPAIFRTVPRLMEIVGAEADFVTERADAWLKGGGNPFQKLPVAVQRRVLQLQLFKLEHDVDFDLIEKLREGDVITVSPETTLRLNEYGIVENRSAPATGFSADETQICLDSKPGEIEFDGKRIRLEIEEASGAKFPRQKNAEHFDADKIGPMIHLRHWRPGDRFHPIGADSPRKLQDLFTNLKIPKTERHRRILAVTEKGEIFWVEGMRISEPFKLLPSTRRRLCIRWSKQVSRH